MKLSEKPHRTRDGVLLVIMFDVRNRKNQTTDDILTELVLSKEAKKKPWIGRVLKGRRKLKQSPNND